MNSRIHPATPLIDLMQQAGGDARVDAEAAGALSIILQCTV